MNYLPVCPVCQEVDDCEHCLIEWCEPGERTRGVLLGTIRRIENVAARLLAECAAAAVPPRDPRLKDAYEEAYHCVEAAREAASAGASSEAEWERQFHGVKLDLDELREECEGDAATYALQCVRESPGVVESVVDERSKDLGESSWVSLWAADPLTMRLRLLDTLSSLEVQLDQLVQDSYGVCSRLDDKSE
jgi:hypothetical protein